MNFLRRWLTRRVERRLVQAQRPVALVVYNQVAGQAVRLAESGRLQLADDFSLRFEVVVFFIARVLFLWRQDNKPEAALQALWETTFEGFDHTLRQRGVNDIRMAARMNKLFRYATGRRDAYLAAWTTDDTAALHAAMARNVLNGASPDDLRVGILLEALLDVQASAGESGLPKK
jgi:hypothetical protein